MRLFNYTLLKQQVLTLLLTLLFLTACNNAAKDSPAADDESAVYVPENFIHPDTVAVIRKEVLSKPCLTNTVKTTEGLDINIPLFYYYEAGSPTIPLPFLKESDDTNEEDEEQAGATPQKNSILAYDLIPTLSDKYEFDEKVVIADTSVDNETILAYFKENNYERVDKLIYEDATSYIGVGSFNAIIIFSFSSDTVTGNRSFYYAKCKPQGLSPKETVRFAFQLAQHGQQFLQKQTTPATAGDFADQLNEEQYKIVDKISHSAKKEAAVFLDDKSYVSYKLFPQMATLYLLPDALAGQLIAYTSSLAFNQATPVTTLAELCDAVDMNFINLWRQETVIRTQSSTPDSGDMILLEILPSDNDDDSRRLHILAPITKNKKTFLLWLEVRDDHVNNFDKAAYTRLIQLIQSKI